MPKMKISEKQAYVILLATLFGVMGIVVLCWHMWLSNLQSSVHGMIFYIAESIGLVAQEKAKENERNPDR